MIGKRPNVKIVCDECNSLMIRKEFGMMYYGFTCTNNECKNEIDRDELYKNWDLDYRESWHIDITEDLEYNEHFNKLVEGLTIEEITDNPYIFTKSPIAEATEIIKGFKKLTEKERLKNEGFND